MRKNINAVKKWNQLEEENKRLNEAIDNKLIKWQEEATSKHSSEKERKIAGEIYDELSALRKSDGKKND